MLCRWKWSVSRVLCHVTEEEPCQRNVVPPCLLPSSRSVTRCVSSTALKMWITLTCRSGAGPGTVTEIQGTDTVIIRWSKETLDAIHPVSKKRCEKDGLDLEVYGLTGEDLESDSGGPLRIEHPKKITTKPLSPKDQDDRIRMIFGLTSNDPLPDVDDETLEAYHEHLCKDLTFLGFKWFSEIVDWISIHVLAFPPPSRAGTCVLPSATSSLMRL